MFLLGLWTVQPAVAAGARPKAWTADLTPIAAADRNAERAALDRNCDT